MDYYRLNGQFILDDYYRRLARDKTPQLNAAANNFHTFEHAKDRNDEPLSNALPVNGCKANSW